MDAEGAGGQGSLRAVWCDRAGMDTAQPCSACA